MMEERTREPRFPVGEVRMNFVMIDGLIVLVDVYLDDSQPGVSECVSLSDLLRYVRRSWLCSSTLICHSPNL